MLRFLRGVGIPVGTIIDVGAREETLELRQAFPDLRHILFEPASEFHDALRTNYASMDYVLVPAALSDQEGRGYLRKIAIGGNKISHSWLVDDRVIERPRMPGIDFGEREQPRHDDAGDGDDGEAAQGRMTGVEEWGEQYARVPSRKWLKFGWRSLRGAHPS
jgi:hypothetical protein